MSQLKPQDPSHTHIFTTPPASLPSDPPGGSCPSDVPRNLFLDPWLPGLELQIPTQPRTPGNRGTSKPLTTNSLRIAQILSHPLSPIFQLSVLIL